jgi:hypothetical protein
MSPASSLAALIDSDLQITGTVNFLTDPDDPSLGLVANTSSTQTGEISLTSDGVLTSAQLDGQAITGSSTLSDSLMQTGDGMSMDFSLLSMTTNEFDVFSGVFGDYQLDFTNLTMTDTFTVVLRVEYTQFSDVSDSDAEAYVDNLFKLAEGEDLSGALLINSDVSADTLFNPPGPGPNSLTTTEYVVLTIDPNETFTLSALQDLFSEAFRQGNNQGSSTGEVSSEITLLQGFNIGAFSGETHIWDGASGDLWSDTANWSGGVVPGATDTVAIAPSSNNQIDLNGDRTVHSLQVMDAGTYALGDVPGADTLTLSSGCFRDPLTWTRLARVCSRFRATMRPLLRT